MSRLAVLMTCHNRKLKTISCLESLFVCELPEDIDVMDVFLVDDGSTDGTSKAIKNKFPKVNVILGSGNLFWNKGMRFVWETAIKEGQYDFFLWLNDDVVLENIAILELFAVYNETYELNIQDSIITGACRNAVFENEFSYGGRNDSGNVVPNGKLQTCKYINGNVVLISKKIHKKLGNLSPEYTHGMGDFDYGLRAIECGFQNYTTKTYIGVCPKNGHPKWSDPSVSLKQRLKLFKSPTGLNYKEYIVFRKKFWGNKWVIYALKAYIKVLLPIIYQNLKNHK